MKSYTRQRGAIPSLPLTFVCALLFSGCATIQEQHPAVSVSQPQARTRERLVVSREREIQFLKSQLDLMSDSVIVGARDRRSSAGFENELSAVIDPSVALPLSSVTNSSTNPAGSQTNLPPNALQKAENASIDPYDRFQDIRGYRGSVNAAIREEELDDIHDRAGRTLYTLQFITTLLPSDDNTSPRLVRLRMSTPDLSPTEKEELFTQWMARLNLRLNEDEKEIITRLYKGQISSEDERLILNFTDEGATAFKTLAAFQVAEVGRTKIMDFADKARQTALNLFLTVPNLRSSQLQKIMASEIDRYALITGIGYALHAKYTRDFKGLVTIKYNINPGIADETYVTAELVPLMADGCEVGKQRFVAILDGWISDQSHRPYADSVSPAYYAQNISDASSRARFLDLGFAISASISQAATVSEKARYQRQSALLLQAIKRQPLAVSFAGGSEFGWLLCAPFGIAENGQSEFIHTPRYHSFSVSVVVPVWLRKLQLEGDVMTIDEDGESRQLHSLTFHPVALPLDLDALTTAIQLRHSPPAPSLHLSQLQLLAGTAHDQTLLIRGRELWRNPEVFVGNVRAEKVELLPDMKGLVAHFQQDFRQGKQDLTVVTSFGSASLDQAVTIEANSESEISAHCKLISSYAVVGESPIQFSARSLPNGYAGFALRLSEFSKSGDWVKIENSNIRFSEKDGMLSVSSANLPTRQSTSPLTYSVDFGIYRTPFSLPVSIMDKSLSQELLLVLFPTKDQEKLKIAEGASISLGKEGVEPKFLPIRLATNVRRTDLYTAYAGLERSIKSSKSFLHVKPVGEPAKRFQVKEDGDGFVAVTTEQDGVDLKAGSYQNLSVRYENSSGAIHEIPVLGELIIRRP